MSAARGAGPRIDADDRPHAAIDIRDEWRRHALSALPADRPAAEAAISELYRLIDRRPPRFVWVDSPAGLLTVLRSDGGPEPSDLRLSSLPNRLEDWPIASQLAHLTSTLRNRLDAGIRRRVSSRPLTGPDSRALARSQPPVEALRQGARLEHVVEATVWESLDASVNDTVRAPLRAALMSLAGGSTGLTWYGQHDAHWIARYDAWRRLDLLRVLPSEDRLLDTWSALARSCGWWWPFDDTCVVSERPVAVHTEPMPGGLHGQTRLHHDDVPAVRYADGWGLYALHGTPVPEWVITDPTAERITGERNIEVRRSAIERIGWDAYIRDAGLDLVAVAPDPGNPGCDLHLYDMPARAWGPPSRVLLAVNGSVERDGRRRRYGLTVPSDLDDPVAAAGWSYGLSAEVYARLLRRT
ncbi:DUF6745 domain-containing protein [Thermomonospora umbrina]|uniref:DUF6745 domain-containing protein n=1 Tax=Thermomonospora umbrina TaxID=111806 RepID=A0A3D9SN39_9ACTN|nr:hypothetical protein [Thermomonospora umbrina]REE95840.1 hypothetical protein DFJ69_1254 [Thermomonospora umbrina]